MASYSKAIAIKPDLAEAHYNLGNTLKLKHQYLDALESISRALQIDPKIPNALQSYSSLLVRMSNFTDVKKFSDDALKFSGGALNDGLHHSKFNEQSKIWEGRLFGFIYHPGLSAEEICAEHIKWGSRFAHLGQEGFAAHNRNRIVN